jgi:hypothetical protein
MPPKDASSQVDAIEVLRLLGQVLVHVQHKRVWRVCCDLPVGHDYPR